MATVTDNDITKPQNLSELFDSAFAKFNSLQNTQEPTNSLKVQLEIKKCMSALEEATKLVSMADLFSTNEDFEEIPTEHIKYFLLPALLGSLATKLCDRDNQLHNLKVCEVYFTDFLQRVKSYGLTNVEIPEIQPEDTEEASKSVKSTPTNTEMVEQMVHDRQSKLQRYKEQKALEEQLKILQQSMDNPNIDEDAKRKYFNTLIKSYVMQAVDELNSIAAEKKIVVYLAKVSKEGDDKLVKKEQRKTTKLEPIIITKNAAQKQVFGAGYPSLPVMTVDEFYEKKIADGEWTAASAQTTVRGKSLQDLPNSDEPREEDPDAIRQEQMIERDDEEYLAHARAMDEYKDTHKRGWGNRYNRS